MLELREQLIEEGRDKLHAMALKRAAEAKQRLHDHLIKGTSYPKAGEDMKAMIAERMLSNDQRTSLFGNKNGIYGVIASNEDPEKALDQFIYNMDMGSSAEKLIAKCTLRSEVQPDGTKKAPSKEEISYVKKNMKAFVYENKAEDVARTSAIEVQRAKEEAAVQKNAGQNMINL